MFRSFIFAFLIALTVVPSALAQSPVDRTKSRTQNRLGWDYIQREQFENAVKAFQAAVEIDPTFDMPWYGLGRANLALKQFVAAISALSRCRDLYVAQIGRQFTNQQEAQRVRQDRMTEIDEMIRQFQSGPQTLQRQDQLRQLQEHRRQLQEYMTRGNTVAMEGGVPAWVSLSLGSAYFRSGKLADAERELKEAATADRRSGEALNNLAVVYLETQRYELANTTIKAAKDTGFKVNPELEKAIREKAKQ